VYKGLKENGSIFSHPNPWAWAAECVLGRGDRAMQFYDALCPYWQNDKIETRKAEPYSYCQFITGRDHKKFGEAHHPFMTGSGGWSYVAATRYMLGIRFEKYITSIDHWIAFILLGFIGGKMVYEAVKEKDDDAVVEKDLALNQGEMLLLAIATSIDALAVGIMFAFTYDSLNIYWAIAIIGLTTFVLSIIGVIVGNFFGNKYKKKSEIAGGIILILIGVKILLEHLGIISF